MALTAPAKTLGVPESDLIAEGSVSGPHHNQGGDIVSFSASNGWDATSPSCLNDLSGDGVLDAAIASLNTNEDQTASAMASVSLLIAPTTRLPPHQNH